MARCACAQTFASRANKRITIEQLAVTHDSLGDSVESWTTLATVWAIMEPKNSREANEQRQLQGRTVHKITIRYRADMNPAQTGTRRRIAYGGRLFNITGVINPEEDDEFLELTCEEGVAA